MTNRNQKTKKNLEAISELDARFAQIIAAWGIAVFWGVIVYFIFDSPLAARIIGFVTFVLMLMIFSCASISSSEND